MCRILPLYRLYIYIDRQREREREKITIPRYRVKLEYESGDQLSVPGGTTFRQTTREADARIVGCWLVADISHKNKQN